MKTSLLQRHSLLICHCHLQTAVVEIEVVKWREVKTNCSAIVRSHGREFLI